MAVPAQVIHILGRAGTKGVTRIRAKILDERGRGRVLIRNVMGPIKLGDIIMISEVEMEYAAAIE